MSSGSAVHLSSDTGVQPESEPDPTPSLNIDEHASSGAISEPGEDDIDLPSHRFDDDIENDDELPTPSSSQINQTADNDAPDDPNFLTPVNLRKPLTDPHTSANVSAIKPVPLPTRASERNNDLVNNDVTQLNETDPTDNEFDMLSKLTHAPLSASNLLSEWLVQLTINGPASVASLLSLVIAIGRPTGVLAHQQLVTPDMVIANQPHNNIASFSAILSTDPNARVPILAKDAHSKRARKAYEDFWCRLPTDASNVVIFDTDCVETLISWLEPMACSASRGLRTAACYAAYRMVDGFIAVKMRLQKDLSSMQRQLSSERTKSGDASATPSKSPGRPRDKPLSAKGKELARKVEELSTNNSELSELCDRVFRSVFVLKYRDVSPDIRGLSVKALGSWIMALPRQFLDDIHLKYIGWLLFDKDASVRKSAMEVVLSVVSKKDLFRNLNTFLGRFCGRVVEMCRDKDDTVAISAINILTHLEPHDVLDRKSREIVCALAIEETQVDIRRAAGEFLSHMIIRKASSQQPPTASGKKAQRPSGQKGKRALAARALEQLGEVPSLDISREHIKQLLADVTRKSSEHCSVLAVDAVWDHLPALRCWDAFTSFLVDRTIPSSSSSRRTSRTSSRKSTGSASTTTGESGISDSDKVSLCEILLASAIEASGKGDEARAKLITQSETDGAESPSESFTRFMVLELPKVLTHFQADGQVMKYLVQLPRLYRLDTLEQESFKPHLKSLLNRLVDALTRHSGETGVTFACSDTFRCLLSDENPIKAMTMQTLQLACRKATKEFCVAVMSGLADVEPETVRVSLVRLRVLSELVEPSVSILDPLLKLLEHQIEKGSNSELSDEVTSDAVRTMIGLVVWSLLRFRSRLNNPSVSNLNPTTFFEASDIQEAQKRGADIVSRILEMCACVKVSPYVNTVSLQGLLTIMTLCAGIEKLLVERMQGSGTGSTSPHVEVKNQIDLLSLKARRDVLADVVKQSTISLIEHELQLRSHRRGKSSKQVEHSDVPLKQCMAALIQASIQSPISKEICHLPLMGLLLKGKRGRQENNENDVSIVDICRRYYEHRIMRGSRITEEEIRILMDCGSLERRNAKSFVTSRDMAEIFVSFRRRSVERNALSLHILRVLVDWVVDEDHDVKTIVDGVRMLCNVATGMLGYLTGEGSQYARQKLKALEEVLKKDWIVEECGEVEASVEGLIKALEAIQEFGPGQYSRTGTTDNGKGSQHVDSDDESEDNIPAVEVEGERATADNERSSSVARNPIAKVASRRSSRRTSPVDNSIYREQESSAEMGDIIVHNEEVLVEADECGADVEGNNDPKRASSDNDRIEVDINTTDAVAKGHETKVQNGDEHVFEGKLNSLSSSLHDDDDLRHQGNATNLGQLSPAEIPNGTSEPNVSRSDKKRKGAKHTSVEIPDLTFGANSDDKATKPITRPNGSSELGDKGTGPSLVPVDEEEGTNGESTSKRPPPRRSKRRRSTESSQLVGSVASKIIITKRPRTPKSIHVRHSSSRTENEANSVEDANIDRNGGRGIRTRSATKISRELVTEEAETTPSKPTVRRRKRYHW